MRNSVSLPSAFPNSIWERGGECNWGTRGRVVAASVGVERTSARGRQVRGRKFPGNELTAGELVVIPFRPGGTTEGSQWCIEARTEPLDGTTEQHGAPEAARDGSMTASAALPGRRQWEWEISRRFARDLASHRATQCFALGCFETRRWRLAPRILHLSEVRPAAYSREISLRFWRGLRSPTLG